MKPILMIAVRSAFVGVAIVVAYQHLPVLLEEWKADQPAQW